MATSIREEIAADQGKPTTCQFCRWISQQPEAEQEEWRTVSRDTGSYTHASIHRALLRRGAKLSRGQVENHRTAGHR